MYAVFYISSRAAKIFANIPNELIAKFDSQESAIDFCNHLNECGILDENHNGYEVRIIS